MKLNSFSLAALVFLLLFGGIGFTSAMNWWQTETQKVPVKYAEGEASGQYNPADIRGSYTFGDVSELFDVPLVDLQAAFRLPKDVDPSAYQVKSLEAQFADLPVEMGTGAVRMFVAFYKGLPYAIPEDETTYLFAEASTILKAQNRMQPDQARYLKTHIVQETPAEDNAVSEPAATMPVVNGQAVTPAVATEVVEAGETPLSTEHAAQERKVTGKTTFQDLIDWGVSQETIEAILGEAMPAPQTVIKDHLSAQGLEFSSLKTRFQTEVDKGS